MIKIDCKIYYVINIYYLIQPPDLLDTHQYKIGCLKNNDIKKFEGSRIICMIECDNQYKVKYYIKEDLTKKFNGDIITEIKNIIIKNSTKNMYKSKIEYNKYDLVQHLF